MTSKNSVLQIVAMGLLFFSLSSAHGQTQLAQIIANDAGSVPANYQSYADSLAKTLKMFSAAQLAEIFEGSPPSTAESGNQNSPATSPEHQQALDNLSAAQTAVGAAEVALADAQGALAAVIADEAGLKTDGIPNNYGQALTAAQDDLAAAQEDYDTALLAQDEAIAEVEAFEN